jgi:hypothetical protein
MSQEDLTRIKVNKQSVGIIGLKDVMEEMAEEYAERPDAQVRTALIKRLSRRNYIPDQAKGDIMARPFYGNSTNPVPSMKSRYGSCSPICHP